MKEQKKERVNEKSKVAKAKAKARERNFFFFFLENIEGILVRELKFKIF